MASLNVVTLTNVFSLSVWESKAYTTVNKLEIKKLMKQKSSKLISQAYSLHRKVRKKEPVKIDQAYNLNRTLEEFKLLSR